MTRVQLTDEEWEFIEPYLPIGGVGPYPERLRQHSTAARAHQFLTIAEGMTHWWAQLTHRAREMN